jgi:hypothetical protein
VASWPPDEELLELEELDEELELLEEELDELDEEEELELLEEDELEEEPLMETTALALWAEPAELETMT